MRRKHWYWIAGGAAAVAAVASVSYIATRKPAQGTSGSPRIVATTVNGRSLANTETVTPVYPAYDGTVTLQVGLSNTGAASGNYSVAAYTVLAGSGPNGTVEGHLGESGSPTTPITGTLAGNTSVTATLTSGSIAYASSLANYNPSAGLDVYLVVTDTTTGGSTTYYLPSAIYLPSSSGSSGGGTTAPTAPTAAPSLSTSLSSDTATLNWGSVANAQSYEVQQTTASGSQVSLFNGGVSVTGGSSGTQTTDAQGVYGDFVIGNTLQLQLPAGEVFYFRVRGVNGTGGTGPAGPWSNIVQVSTPAGTPNIVLSISDVSFGAVSSSTNPAYVPVTFKVTATNTGDAPGVLSAMWAVVVPQFGSTPNDVAAAEDVGAWYSGVILNPGQSLSQTVSTTSVGFGVPLLSNPQTFYINVALSTQGGVYYEGTPQDYLYQVGKTFTPVPGNVRYLGSYS